MKPFAIKSAFKSFDFYDGLLVLVLLFVAYLKLDYVFADRLWSDEGLYAWFGKRIFDNPFLMFSKEISYSHPPLFSCFLALAHIFLPSKLACYFVPFVFSLVGIVSTYLLGKKIGSKFLGLFCAIALALNFHYFVVSTMILIDAPLMVFCVIYAVFLLNIHAESSFNDHWMIGLWGILIILLKSYAAMILPWVFLYYFLGIQGIPVRERIKKFLIPGSLMITMIIFLGIKNYCQLGVVSTSLHAVGHLTLARFWTCLMTIKDIIPFSVFWFFFCFGFYVLMMRKAHKIKVLILSWMIISILSLSSSVIFLESRFCLLVLPFVLIITGIGVEAVVDLLRERFPFKIFSKQFIVFCCVLLFCIPLLMYRIFLSIFNQDFTGYEQAGTLVKQLHRPGDLVIAGSERQIRYHSDINYQEFGGDIIPFREERQDFEKLISSHLGPIILVADRWEQIQPDWMVLNGETKNYLEKIGFRLINVVKVPRLRNGGETIYAPAIWILKRP